MRKRRAKDGIRRELLFKTHKCLLRRSEDSLMDIGRVYRSRIIDWHSQLCVPNGVPLGNMSLCRIENGYLVSIRQFNYTLAPGCARCRFFHDFGSDRAYHFALADENFGFVRRIESEKLEAFEDFRLISLNGGKNIQASGTILDLEAKTIKMSSLELDFDGRSLSVAKKCVFPLVREKNYVPVEDGPGVFVSDMLLNSLNVVSVANPAQKRLQRCRGLVKYRGSTQLLRWRDGYVAIVHRRERSKFFNAFAFFDKALLQCRISDEFTVFSDFSPVNFCCGMAINGDKAIVPFCVHDCKTHLFELPITDFAMTARWRDLNRCEK